MINVKSLFCNRLGMVWWVWVSCLLSGCKGRESLQPKVVSTPAPRTRGVFYPPAPDVPRLQFLTSFSKSTDLGPPAKKKVGRFEKFVLGEEQEEVADTILKPYGIALDRDKLYVCDVQK